jgi:hypothetical protein
MSCANALACNADDYVMKAYQEMKHYINDIIKNYESAWNAIPGPWHMLLRWIEKYK